MLSAGDVNRGVIVRGIDATREDAVADIGIAHAARRALRPQARRVRHRARRPSSRARCGVRIGDTVVAITPQGTVTPAGTLPRVKSFKVVGIFEIGMFEFDSGLALIDLDDAQKLYRVDGVSGVRLKLDDLFAAPARRPQTLARTLGVDAELRDWTQSHANFFRAVQIEKRVMFIILTLIVAVAAFNIVSAQVMLVTDKQADIAILRTLGASPASILAIFMIQGALIGIIGTLIGVVGGILLALNVETVVPAIERTFGITFLDKSVYYISDLPSDLQRGRRPDDRGRSRSVLALVATLYPSWRAARVNPAAALRYE